MNEILDQINALKQLENEWLNMSVFSDIAITTTDVALIEMQVFTNQAAAQLQGMNVQLAAFKEKHTISIDASAIEAAKKTVEQLGEGLRDLGKVSIQSTVQETYKLSGASETTITSTEKLKTTLKENASVAQNHAAVFNDGAIAVQNHAKISSQNSLALETQSKQTEKLKQNIDLVTSTTTSLNIAQAETVKHGGNLVDNFVKPGITALQRISDVTAKFGVDTSKLAPVFDTLNQGMSIYNSVMEISKIKLGEMTIAEWLLNSALFANPIVWIIAAIIGLVGAIIYAWKHFEGFRGVVFGLWNGFKETFGAIGNIAKSILGGVADLITGIFTFDTDKMKEGLNELKEGAKTTISTFSKGFTTGQQEGINSFNGDNKTQNPAVPFAQPALPSVQAPQISPQQFIAISPQAAPSFNNRSIGQHGAETSDGITGGGGKNITINVNKSFIENFTINVKDMKEGYDTLKQKIEEVLLEILNHSNAIQA